MKPNLGLPLSRLPGIVKKVFSRTSDHYPGRFLYVESIVSRTFDFTFVNHKDEFTGLLLLRIDDKCRERDKGDTTGTFTTHVRRRRSMRG